MLADYSGGTSIFLQECMLATRVHDKDCDSDSSRPSLFALRDQNGPKQESLTCTDVYIQQAAMLKTEPGICRLSGKYILSGLSSKPFISGLLRGVSAFFCYFSVFVYVSLGGKGAIFSLNCFE